MVKRIISTVLIFTIVFILYNPVSASNGTQVATIGARATAMGSCFRGLADDWSAIYFNPAGLVQLDSKWTIGGSMGLIMPRANYTAHQLTPAFPGLDTKQHDATAQNYFIPTLSVFYKASEKLVLGLGMYVPNGLGTEWDIYHAPSVNEGWINQNPLSKEKENYSDHNVINIQPTIAYKLSSKLSVGIGLFYTTGKMTLRQIGLPVVSADPFMRGFTETYLDGNGTAMGANIGVLFKASEKFSIGVSGRYSTDLALEGTSETVIATPQINLTPEQLVTIGGQPNPGIPEGDVSADLPMPMILSGGIAYHISPKLTVTADVFWTNWESWDVITIEGEDFTGADAEAGLRQDWKNTLETGFGIEYLTSEKLALRGGFYTVDTPAPPETMSPTIPDPSRRYVITGGFGYTMGNISFNLAGEYVLFGETDVEDYEFDNTLTPENYAGIYNFNAVVITFGTEIKL